MDSHRPHVSRRSFLGSLAAAGSAAGLGDLLGPPSIVAAKSPPQARQLSPNFVDGIVTGVVDGGIIIHAPGYEAAVPVTLTRDTDICFGSCRQPTHVLAPGQRANAGTYLGTRGVRVARWININPVVGWGCVSAIRGNVLTISPMGADEAAGRVERDVEVQPYTINHMRDMSIVGSADCVSLDDTLHFTGCAYDSSPYATRAMGMVLHQWWQ